MTKTIPVQMPKLTMAAIEATFMQWLVPDGEYVIQDQPLYVVETDKVETEVPSPGTGILRHGAAEPEQAYPVGTLVATIEVVEGP
jgi:pyruvate/2-oxoglutarate dehydrogenase complex dihydrolipoamide acyltransferase (E2) component